MPIRTITQRERPATAEELTKRLVRELRRPGRTGQPDIVIEQPRPGQPAHLYVIWDDWKDLSLQERSEIIMDAYGTAEGKRKSLLVTMAMGLTEVEAERLLPSLLRGRHSA